MNPAVFITLLSLTQTTGPVAPAYQHTTVCNIGTQEVRSMTTGPVIDFPHTILRQTRYSAEIPNYAVLENLIMETAYQAGSIQGPTLIGGSRTIYTATVPRTGKELKLRSLAGMQVYQQINTPSAMKLVRFINLNCGK